MSKIQLIRKGIFPLKKLRVSINNSTYMLNGNETIEFDLPPKDYIINLKMNWWNSSSNIKIDSNTHKIVIRYCLSDIFFIVGLIVILILSILTFFLMINSSILIISVLIFVLPQLYYLLIKRNSFFYVKNIYNER
jgi:hypothetical protein